MPKSTPESTANSWKSGSARLAWVRAVTATRRKTLARPRVAAPDRGGDLNTVEDSLRNRLLPLFKSQRGFESLLVLAWGGVEHVRRDEQTGLVNLIPPGWRVYGSRYEVIPQT